MPIPGATARPDRGRMLSTICVIHDGTIDAQPALELGLDLKQRSGAALELVGVDGDAPVDPVTEAQALSAELLGPTGSDDDVMAHIQRSRPDLVVTAERGVARLRDRFFGSLARRLARAAPCPVVYAQRPADTGRGSVMLLTGYVEPAQAEIEFAVEMASLNGTEVQVAGLSHQQAITAAARQQLGMIVVSSARLGRLDLLAASVLCPVAVVPQTVVVPEPHDRAPTLAG